jgi:hypothetical protein
LKWEGTRAQCNISRRMIGRKEEGKRKESSREQFPLIYRHAPSGKIIPIEGHSRVQITCILSLSSSFLSWYLEISLSAMILLLNKYCTANASSVQY